jgi:hypothetical protein
MSLSRRDSDAGYFTASFVSGGRTDVRSSSLRSWGSVVRAMTQDELLKALNKAQDVSYVAPGVGVHASLNVTSRPRRSSHSFSLVACSPCCSVSSGTAWRRSVPWCAACRL